MKIAMLISQRATCLRGSVGCIITMNNRIISSGYNGVLHGEKECSSNTCDISNNCKRAVHAEVNAIAAAARHGVSLIGAELITTCAPCTNCAMIIAQSGITSVLYKESYSNSEGLTLLGKMGVRPRQYVTTETV